MQFLNLPEQADIAVQKMQNGEFNSIGKISVDGNAQRFGVFPQIRSSFTGTARLQKVENTVNPVRLLFKAVHPVTNAGNNSLPESPAVCLQLLAVGKGSGGITVGKPVTSFLRYASNSLRYSYRRMVEICG